MLAILLSIATGSAVAAHHEARVDGSDLVWSSRIVTDGGGLVTLSRPLLEATSVTASVPLVRDANGHVIGLDVPELSRARVDVTVRQPRQDGVMAAPLVPAPQRIVFAERMKFTPDANLGIEQRVGRLTTSEIDFDDRRHLRELFPDERRTDSLPIYLGKDAQMLSGTLVDLDARKWNVALTLLVASFALVGLLAFCARLLARRAAAERAERIIEQEWRSIG